MPIGHESQPALRRGLNLGGWLSQTDDLSPRHVREFVTALDLRTIASWGFDHVRLPLDWGFVTGSDELDPPRATAVRTIRRFCAEAADAGLDYILDLHVAPVHTFQQRGNPLWEAASAQAAADTIGCFWDNLLAAVPVTEQLVIDILNEPSTEDVELWSGLADRIVERVRQRGGRVPVIVEGPDRGSARLWSQMSVPDTDCLLGLHVYDPIAFTHQQAFWSDVLPWSNHEQHYPGRLRPSAEPVSAEFADQFEGVWDGDRLLALLAPAARRGAELGVAVHCGEFGAFVAGPPNSRYAWVRDVRSLLEDLDVGWCYWTYRDMGFGVVYDNPLDDYSGRPEYVDGLDPVLLEVLTSDTGASSVR